MNAMQPGLSSSDASPVLEGTGGIPASPADPSGSTGASVDEHEVPAEGVKILPDGSTQVGSVVHLKVLGRDIWYDIEQHGVLRWQDHGRGSEEPL